MSLIIAKPHAQPRSPLARKHSARDRRRRSLLYFFLASSPSLPLQAVYFRSFFGFVISFFILFIFFLRCLLFIIFDSFFLSVISFFILIFFFLRCLPFLPPPPRYFLFFSTLFLLRVPPPPHHSLPLPFSASEFLTFLTHLSKIQFKMTVASKVFGFSKKGTYHKTPFAQRHFPNKNIIPSSQSLH